MLNAFCDKCGDTFTSVKRKRGYFVISHKNTKYYLYYEFYVSEYLENNRKIHKYVICINEDEDNLYDQIHNTGITENGFQMEMNYSNEESRKTDLDELFDKMLRFVKHRFAVQLKRERREIFDELLFHKIDQTLYVGDTVTFQEILDEYKEKTQDLVLKTI